MGPGSAAVSAATLRGVEAVPVTVEVSVSGGIPALDIVGMPDSAVLEARSRVRCAIREAGFTVPRSHVTIGLRPGEVRKTGTGFDLPIAIGILIATGQLAPRVAEGALVVGELGLEGEVLPVRGEAAYALLAQRLGLALLASADTSLPASWVPGGRAVDALSRLRSGPEALLPLGRTGAGPAADAGGGPDFADVADQELAKRAMLIAAAGRHGLLMVGPPGAGKTMLARRLPTILPPLSEEEVARTLLVHSVAGQPVDAIARGVRPFRAPHHSISVAGLVGGGRPVLPGEVSLADHGVLFLDELPEFQRGALQALRQPLEDHEVRIVRADGAYAFPCDFQLVAAANPCPCGHLGDPGHECVCPPAKVRSYQARMGGPLLDRIDVVVDVARPKSSEVIRGSCGTGSAEMAERVLAAREFSAWRRSRGSAGPGELGGVLLEASAAAAFEHMAERMGLGGRAIVRVARVARTVADLDRRERVATDDLVEALGFRPRTDA